MHGLYLSTKEEVRGAEQGQPNHPTTELPNYRTAELLLNCWIKIFVYQFMEYEVRLPTLK